MNRLMDRATVALASLAVAYWLVSWITRMLAEVAR